MGNIKCIMFLYNYYYILQILFLFLIPFFSLNMFHETFKLSRDFKKCGNHRNTQDFYP